MLLKPRRVHLWATLRRQKNSLLIHDPMPDYALALAFEDGHGEENFRIEEQSLLP